jgi:hypothetical protein
MSLLPRWLLLAMGAPLVFTACANIGPPEPPSLDLPKPPSDLHALRKGGKVTLTWTIPTLTTDRQAVHSFGATRICRGLQAELTQCSPVGEAAPGKAMRKSPEQKISTSYTDVLPSAVEVDDPSSFLSYAVEVLNADGRGAGLSNQVRVSLARTLPPPKDLNAHITARGVVLDWTSAPLPASPPAVRFAYRVYRRQESDPQKVLVSEAPAGERHLSLTDSDIEWQKTYEYHTEAVTLVAQEGKPEVQVEGDDSPEVKVFADDVFPPTVPSGLQAVFSGPGQQPFIDLVWAPDTDADLNGYNVYRHEEGTEPMKLNAEAIKAPAYRDGSVAAGKHYFYSVSAVDLRGNESQRSEEASETVP